MHPSGRDQPISPLHMKDNDPLENMDDGLIYHTLSAITRGLTEEGESSSSHKRYLYQVMHVVNLPLKLKSTFEPKVIFSQRDDFLECFPC